MTTTATWLHFSDIHVGMAGQKTLWSRFDYQLLKDLETIQKKSGSIDLIIFSGDLVQKGEAAEYDKFDEVIGRIFMKLAELGMKPGLITVPGNHDLLRPDPLTPDAMALAQYWNSDPLKSRFWSNEHTLYRDFINEAFTSYVLWRDRAIVEGRHVAPVRTGILPGDAAYIFDASRSRIGVIALNSTWLQLGGGDYDGHLHVDPRQLLALTGDYPDDWVSGNDVNVLTSHHPTPWLHQSSQISWKGEIDPPGRFDVHLFGHMHQPTVLSSAHGGALTRREVQAASLFGLETYGNGEVERIQGYSANRVIVEGSYRTFTSWPRRLIRVAGGESQLTPDNSLVLDEDTSSFSVEYQVQQSARVRETEPCSIADGTGGLSQAPEAQADFDLSAIRFQPLASSGHRNVRKIEQQTCLNVLADRKVIWIVADWGMGEDGFVQAIRDRLQVHDENVYRLDFSEYSERDTFLGIVRSRYGATFQQICENLSGRGPAILIFDDVNSSGLTEVELRSLEEDIENLALTVSDFAPETNLLIRARRAPISNSLAAVRLDALDEADVAAYARESEIGGERYAKPDAVSKLFRHTDGIPNRLDAVLRDLEIISLDDLAASNPDLESSGSMQIAAPPGLAATISELESSEDRTEQRSYRLLLALASLPQGEQLTRIKRFLGPHPFHPANARALLERSLITTSTITGMGHGSVDSSSKTLVVPRPVREYVRESVPDEVSRSNDRRALELYFGEKWGSGEIESAPTVKRVGAALCDHYEIQNGITLVVRNARRSVFGGSEMEAGSAIRLGSAFVEALMSGDHYRSAASLCDDLIRVMEEANRFERELNVLRYEHARSLRMMSEYEQAKTLFECLDQAGLSKHQRQLAELELAWCYKRVANHSAAAEAARRAIGLDRGSDLAIQAKVVLAEQIQDSGRRREELMRLLEQARRKKASTAENNIRLTLAQEHGVSKEESEAHLRTVIANPTSRDDFYNQVRATIELVELNGDRPLTLEEEGVLIKSYHYLYNERLYGLFNRCHAALWKRFEDKDDNANLLQLFRRSSFIWRLYRNEQEELAYLSKLTKKVKSLLAQDVRAVTRDGAYFVVRVSVVLGLKGAERTSAKEK